MSSTGSQVDSRRAGRLRALFRNTLSGESTITTSQHAQLFLEAIQAQDSPSKCIESIVSSKPGLSALGSAVRANLSPSSVVSHSLSLLRYLSDPVIKALADGQILEKVLVALAEPRTYWQALVNHFNNRLIPEESLYPFAWLCLELLSLPAKSGVDVVEDVEVILERNDFLKAQSHDTRNLAYKIKKVIQIRTSPQQAGGATVGGPGGRHDNDHVSFRQIAIYPTTDEFLSKSQPFYRTLREVLDTSAETRAGVHIDNQFRLLREDMLAELREDLQVAIGSKPEKGRRPALALRQLVPVGLDVGGGDDAGPQSRYKKCHLLLQCYDGLQFLTKLEPPPARKSFLKDQPSLLRHQAFGVLTRNKEILGFAFVNRDVDLLIRSPPVVSLQLTDSEGLRKALLAFKSDTAVAVQFILVDTPVFAYEPVLVGLKAIADLPLQEALVNPAAEDTEVESVVHPRLAPLVSQLRGLAASHSFERMELVDLPKCIGEQVRVDASQLESLIHALSRPLSLIQGPPGTGKSFIGAQAAQYLFEAGMRILVISYTNHALDQFMDDLSDVNIPLSSMARLGSKGKCAPSTVPLLLSEQKNTNGYRRSQEAWAIINSLRNNAQDSAGELQKAFQAYRALSVTWQDLSEYLEFEDPRFHEALSVPPEALDRSGGGGGGGGGRGGWKRVGKKGKRVGPEYLFQRWIKGEDAGVFKNDLPPAAGVVWDIPSSSRGELLEQWTSSLLNEGIETLQELVRQFNNTQEEIDVQFSEADAHTLRQKLVLGCTTTGAAKYARLLRAFRPDIIIVEEAGEILESHILTALTSSVKQMVLIGDHKQLRPKINNYALSVEKGEGYDLNRSLFERLIMQGSPHTTLRQQHRMAPEISLFPRELTYPDLTDGPKTGNRPAIRGLRDRVVFLNHGKQEESDGRLRDRRDPGTKQSKTNLFEAEMVLRCIIYFGQQGYSSEQMVVLTPYLGQLRALRDTLHKNQHDPALSELDQRELIRAGLVTEAAAKIDRKPIRISTIDNYQGEESDIVIASLTRSNESADIGFMSAPERLNVLITRARNCLVLIGNMSTFINSKKGATTWQPFFELLKTQNHLYDGLPVRCEQHPETTALLQKPIDFISACPDGGCNAPCNVKLKCGIHSCSFRCHRVTDHSKAECNQLVDKKCERGHKARVRCGRQGDGCQKCIKEDQEQERRIKRDLQLEEERLRRQEAYTQLLNEIQAKIDHQRLVNKIQAEEDEQKRTLEQQRADLAALKNTEARIRLQKQQKAEAARNRLVARQTVRPGDSSTEAAEKSDASVAGDAGGLLDSDTAEVEWKRLKKLEGAQSSSLDTLMGMIGLEEIKQEFLSIKSKIDTGLRQGISLASERFGCCMLGNPGTGKTTVARLYAKFLAELCIIPGTTFKETTGSALANTGVSGCKQLLDDILNDGGGVLFIDEAYQLTSGTNPGGGAVLDFLLAEVENLTGKVVFVLAGYNKQMETFYAHNPGLPSRFPHTFKFADYTDDELLRILEGKINKKYNSAMACEGGLSGLYCRIVARRVGRGRGKEGFGNARAMENTLAVISRRQADRLRRERKAGAMPDDFFLSKEDLIGPEPGEALARCGAWKKLQELIGLGAVKEAVKALVDSIQQTYQRELDEQPPIQYSLNKVFLGNPGTGKTTVAKLYGEVLVALGLLSKGEVIVRNPSDFTGSVLGESEKLTKGILASAAGKVLVIDEAYGLYGGSIADIYKTAVIDTIVAEVQSVPGEDRCVLLLGYADQMETMFQHVNPGLARRFPIASGFVFDDFSDDELRKIFALKIKQQGYQATGQATDVAMDMLKLARNRPNFGNAGEIDILLDAAKARQQRRVSAEKVAAAAARFLEAQDFDKDFDRAQRSETNVRKLFEGSVGCEETVKLLEGHQETVRTYKSLDMDPRENIPFNFLFCGPPGTGKTTTARKMGKVFYDMGFISTAQVVECSATDLIGQYVGHTGPKVLNVLDKALGRVLFIDEAYRLAEGHFAKEAVDELVDSVTKAKYHKKLIIILAGYKNEIDRLLSVNPGLTSRFPEVVTFRALTPDKCISLLLQLLQEQRAVLKEKGKDFDLASLESPTAAFRHFLLTTFASLAGQKNWASARDVQQIAKGVFRTALQAREEVARGRIVLRQETVEDHLRGVLNERKGRCQSPSLDMPELKEALQQMDHPRPAVKTSTATEVANHAPEQQAEEEESSLEPSQAIQDPRSAQRDVGVSDEVWAQLQRDRKAEEDREDEYRKLVEESKRAQAAAREKIVKRLIEEERRRKEEARIREKLALMGACPAGYAWIREGSGGYRCAGGSHWVSDAALGNVK
ncbi:P-loop containing nucleoside triphosphate hydrolase protein [Cercophora scortea]|uniref:P-loop containing nucleoside triphosphate hydrolase protein n=1 Tax=Cercophora scortea TaxID=314031 RepID=A0AAE0I888_9PEZI|nr:P-loop containing nucleoside triphosphate hydrolase protein [Cercophora scortea]